MAIVDESERSLENDYLADVIKDALSESEGDDIPEANNEFWKPVTNPLYFNNEPSTSKATEDENSNQDQNINMEQEIHIIRRSRSADLHPIGAKHEKEQMTMSEMGSEEFKLMYKICSRESVNDSQPPSQHYVSDDEINADDDGPDEYELEYFREYERRIDELELCDFALERTFHVLKTQIDEVYKQLNQDNTYICVNEEKAVTQNGDENQTDSKKYEKDQSFNVEKKVIDSTQNEEKDTKPVDSIGNEASEKQDESTDTNETLNKEQQTENSTVNSPDESGRFMLKVTVAELEERFEHFVSQVGDLIQLGALSTKHAIRMESWAREVQSTYGVLKTDQLKMQGYVEGMEKDWSRRRHQLQYEIKIQADQIAFLMEECCKRSDENTRRNLHKRCMLLRRYI